MPGTRLHRLTTIYLAALYGVIGLTGGSLHYLSSNVTGFWSKSSSVESVVFYHVHGPDFQGHFHRFVMPRHDSLATAEARQKVRHAKYDTALALHQPHACPILTLVSTLKLGQGGCFATPILLDSLVTRTWQSDVICAFDVARYSYVRGPPRVFFA